MTNSPKQPFENEQSCLLSSLLKHVCTLELDTDPRVTAITLDSRNVKSGSLFFAVAGATSDGRDYIGSAIQAGAVAVFAQTNIDAASVEFRDQTPVVYVPALNQKVGVVASEFYGHPSQKIKVIGITGTNGKTTTAQLAQQLFKLLGESAATIGTMGYGVELSALSSTGLTTPDAIGCQRILRELVDSGVERVCMEVSSHAIAQGRHQGINFEGVVFTNLTRDHLDYHGDMETYAAVKSSFFNSDKTKYAVANVADELGLKIYSEIIPSSVQPVGFAINGPVDDLSQEQLLHCVTATNIGYQNSGISALVMSPWGDAELHCPLLGEFNLANVLAVVSVVCAAGYPFHDVMHNLQFLKPISGRMEPVTNIDDDISLCVDYAHTPDALEQALKAARMHTKNKLWVVFGCGGNRDQGKRPLMAKIAEEFADHIVLTSDNPRNEDPEKIINDISRGFELATVRSEIDRTTAIRVAVINAVSGDFVLLAGKGHEQYQLVKGSEIPFDDREVALHMLKRRKSEQSSSTGGEA